MFNFKLKSLGRVEDLPTSIRRRIALNFLSALNTELSILSLSGKCVVFKSDILKFNNAAECSNLTKFVIVTLLSLLGTTGTVSPEEPGLFCFKRILMLSSLYAVTSKVKSLLKLLTLFIALINLSHLASSVSAPLKPILTFLSWPSISTEPSTVSSNVLIIKVTLFPRESLIVNVLPLTIVLLIVSKALEKVFLFSPAILKRSIVEL